MDMGLKWLKLALGVPLMLLVHTPRAVYFLIGFMIADYVSGMIVSGIRGEIDSHVGWVGASKKVLTLLMVSVAYATTIAFDLKLDLGAGVTIVYSVNELVSITENCARGGVKVPRIFLTALAKAKKVADF